MLSFTSSSSRGYRMGACCLIAGVLMICVLTEIVSGRLLDRASLTERRINAQLPHVLRLRHSNPSRKSILIVGNSLLVAGLNPDLLNSELGSSYDVAPLLIESTSYFDWYYGLRHIFRQGAEPDIVVVGLAVTTFLETTTRSDYFSATLLDRRDVLDVSRDLDYTRTAATNLLFGTVSRFWSHRNVIRNRALSAILPEAEMLARVLGRRPADRPTDAQVENQITSVVPARLAAAQKLCADHGARLVVMLPPVSNGKDHVATFARIAARQNTAVILPIPSHTLTANDFVDGVHLEPSRVNLFTRAAVASIRNLAQ